MSADSAPNKKLQSALARYLPLVVATEYNSSKTSTCHHCTVTPIRQLGRLPQTSDLKIVGLLQNIDFQPRTPVPFALYLAPIKSELWFYSVTIARHYLEEIRVPLMLLQTCFWKCKDLPPYPPSQIGSEMTLRGLKILTLLKALWSQDADAMHK